MDATSIPPVRAGSSKEHTLLFHMSWLTSGHRQHIAGGYAQSMTFSSRGCSGDADSTSCMREGITSSSKSCQRSAFSMQVLSSFSGRLALYSSSLPVLERFHHVSQRLSPCWLSCLSPCSISSPSSKRYA